MRVLGVVFINLFLCGAITAQIAIAPPVGNGTYETPYEIGTLENLYWIAADNDVVPNPDQTARWSSHYIQTADIDASETADWFDGQGWFSIGRTGQNFSGSYNGQGNTIDALFLYQPNTD